MKEPVGLDDEIKNMVISARKGFFNFRVQGISMQPALEDGDMLLVQGVEMTKLMPEDIIIYQNIFQDRIVHRIIRKNINHGRAIFLTKGDNSKKEPEFVYPGQILGKVVSVKRRGQQIAMSRNQQRLDAKFYINRFEFITFFPSVLRSFKYIFRHKLLGGLIRVLQGAKIYSLLVKKIISTSKIDYCLANPADVALLARFYEVDDWPLRTEIINESSSGLFKDVNGCFLAQRRGNVISSVLIRRSFSAEGILCRWWMYRFFIDWRYRGMGIEQQLFKLAIERAKSEGVKKVNILVSKKNKFLVNFFKDEFGNSTSAQFDERMLVFTCRIDSR